MTVRNKKHIWALNLVLYTDDMLLLISLHRDGTFYMYELRKKRYNYPFKLDDIKDQLRLKISDWYEEDISELDRDDIEELLIANN